ncbi:MAG: hypothetical protein LBJ18_00700 [Rickettsiales bacterium]|jgi:hypothetical protein|nr:hypothetical protein [Rickettsiales bacterium]
MSICPSVLLPIKYIFAGLLVAAIALAPAYLARVNGKDKLNMGIVRISSWLFGWTGVGWLFALWWAVKK